jgi:uncharacterized protein involved in outer membrane biogenesis
VALFLAVGAASVVAALVVRLDSWRPQIEAAVQRATGRSLRIGHIGLAFSLIPTVQLTSVALGNLPGGSAPEMLTIPRAEVRLALLPLLRGRVEIARVLLVGPRLLLERNKAGVPDWRFSAARPAIPATAAASPASPGFGLGGRLSVRAINVRQGEVTWRDGTGGPPVVFSIAALDAEAGSASAPIHLRLAGTLGSLPVTLTAETGALARLFAAAVAPWPLRLELKVASLTLDAEGAVAPASATAPLTAALHLTASNPQADLAGDARLTLGTRVAVQADFTSRRIDADGLLAALRSPPAGPAADAAQLPPASSRRLFGGTPLPFPLLRLADVTLQGKVAELRFEGLLWREVRLGAELRAGRLTLDPLTATSPGGVVRAKLGVDAAPVSPALTLDAEAPALALAPLLARTSLSGRLSGTLSLAAAFAATGDTPHALASHLGGTLVLALTGGEIDMRLLSQGLALLPQTLPLPLSGLLQSAQTPIRCATLRAHAAAGVVHIDTLGAEAGPVVVSGSGSVDLGQETLAVHVRPLVQVGPGVLVPLRVGGTLLAPSVSSDTAVAMSGIVGLFVPDKAKAIAGGVCGGAAAPAAASALGVPVPSALPKPAQLPGLLRGLLSR